MVVRISARGCYGMGVPMGSRLCAAMAVGLALSACAAKPPPPPQWVRTDGQRLSDNSVLTQQLEIDLTVCQGDTQRTNLSSLTPVARNGCMAEKGYMLFAADQAEACPRTICSHRRPTASHSNARDARNGEACCAQASASGATITRPAVNARRGVPYRGEHRQAAKRAAADIEGHSTAAEVGQPG
jgi:hypothetical protein